jgi:uncharacterized protein (TIGR02145 family)
MKKYLLIIGLFSSIYVFPQSYLITFEGTGESTNVGTVTAENLTKGSSVTLSGSDVLRLNVITGVNQENRGESGSLKIYPNPFVGSSRIEIFPAFPGDAIITVNDLTGRMIAQTKMYLDASQNELILTGLKKGFFLVTIRGSNYNLSGRLLSIVNQGNDVRIKNVSTYHDQIVGSKATSENKGVKGYVDMDYSAGNLIKFTGISGNYSTVKVDNPTQDKIISFNFVNCKDGDNNYYRVVGIGTQTWMAENLKTTKYSDGMSIPFVNTTNGWDILIETDKAFCYLLDNVSNANVYGALYTWAAAMNGAVSSNSNPSGVQGACPTGWHLPSVDEWTYMINYLGGSSLAGGKLKETGTSHWNSNIGATNASGFTAIPGGFRDDWAWFGINNIGGYWSATNGMSRWTDAASIAVTSYTSNKKYGFSVRCLKD